MFYQGGPIEHCTHVPGPVAQSSAESKYNVSYTTGMALVNFRMLNNEFMNKDPDLVLEQSPLIIFDGKSSECMDDNGKGTKHTRKISRRIHFIRNCEECNMHKTVWYDGGPKLADIGTKNNREDELNPRLEYAMVRLEN